MLTKLNKIETVLSVVSDHGLGNMTQRLEY